MVAAGYKREVLEAGKLRVLSNDLHIGLGVAHLQGSAIEQDDFRPQYSDSYRRFEAIFKTLRFRIQNEKRSIFLHVIGGERIDWLSYFLRNDPLHYLPAILDALGVLGVMRWPDRQHNHSIG